MGAFYFQHKQFSATKNRIVYDKEKIDKVWKLTKDNPFSFLAKPFDYYRSYFWERIRKVIKARQLDESICKSFLLAVNQDNLPLDIILDDEEVAYISDFVSSIDDISLKNAINS